MCTWEQKTRGLIYQCGLLLQPFVGPQTGRSSEVAVGGEQAKEPHSLGMLWIHLVWRCAPQFHAKWTLARDAHPIIRIQDFERRSLLASSHVTVH